MTSADCFETCCECDGLTDKAGRGENSLYCEVCDEGPFCADCYKKHLTGRCGATSAPTQHFEQLETAWRSRDMFLSVAEMAELLKHVLAQRDVLQAVVDQLDTTKDGVPIVPGMLLYRVLYGRVDEHEACLAVDTGDYSDPSYFLLSGDEYYSTAELAKLAEAGRSHD